MNEHDTMQPDPDAPETQPRDLRRDLGGLVLFAVAIFLGVSVVMAASRPDPQAGGTTALVTGVVGLLGTWPLLVLSLCLGFLGARVWVAGAVDDLLGNALWSLGLALALALSFGAASQGAGGAFGDLTGGAISRLAYTWVGVPLGLATVGAVVWFGWLRPPEWKPVLSPDEPAPSVYTPSDSEGLTADEAEALLPSEEPLAALGGEVTGRSIPVAPDLPPLYPPDVRREGRIPDGARALESRDEPALRPAADTPQRPELADTAAGIPGEPLAEPAGGAAHQAAPVPVQPPAGAPVPRAAGSALEDLAPSVPRWERPRDLAREPLESEPAAPLPRVASLHISAPPVRSAWEAEEEDGEAVDEDVEEPEVVAEATEVEVEEDVLAADEAEESEIEEDEDVVAEDVDELDPDEDKPDEEDLEEDEDLEDELAEDELEVRAEADDEADLDGDGDADDESAELEDDLDGEPEVVSEAPLAEDPDLVADVAAADEGEAAAEAPAPAPDRAAWEQGGLFDDEPVDAYGTPVTLVAALRQANEETAARIAEPAASAVDTADQTEEAPAAAVPEPAVELQPQPRAEKPKAAKPKAPKAPKSAAPEPAPTSALAPEDDLVFRAGMLFLERGRVAVSMLQRTFELDFKQATDLLDQLQQAGLIGPYLGGQKRDLLLSADEWRERRVGAS